MGTWIIFALLLSSTSVSAPAEKLADPRLAFEFRDIVADGDLETARRMVAQGFDPLIVDHWYCDYLVAAVESDCYELVEYLLELGFDPNQPAWPHKTALGSAAWIGNPRIIEVLLRYGADVHIETESGETPLYKAASGRSLETIKLLLDAGAEIEPKDSTRASPLAEAVEFGIPEIAEFLLEHGANPNYYDYHGCLLLGECVRMQRYEMVRVLLQHGADVNLPAEIDAASRPINELSVFSSAEMAELLAHAGADLESIDRSGYTALQYAVFKENLAVADVLLKYGAYLDLYSAAGLGDVTRLRELIAAGESLSEPHANGVDAVHWAAKRGHRDAVMLLIEHGAEPDLHCYAGIGDTAGLVDAINHGQDVNAFDALGFAAVQYAAANKHTEVIEILVVNGANIDPPGIWQPTPLEMAIDLDDTDFAIKLIELGAAVDGRPCQRKPPLHHAISQHNCELAAYLLDHGADLYTYYYSGASGLPLGYAIDQDDLEIAQLLLDAGYDVNAAIKPGLSALWEAVFSQNIEAIGFLLENGADPNLVLYEGTTDTSDDCTLTYWAYHSYNQEIIDLFLEYGAIPPSKRFQRIIGQQKARHIAHDHRFFSR